MDRIQFAFVLHDHQPLGNFEAVIEASYRKAYAPFLSMLERFPGVKAGLHHTGILLEWIADRHPDYIARLKAMVAKGQVELLTGAYYEPILPSIPDQDKVGQIRKLTAWLRDAFEAEARGMWLAERVWEPSLPRPLKEAGAAYTLLDDAHFDRIAVPQEERFGYFLTEEQGSPVALFPIHQPVRHAIPFEVPERTLEILSRWADDAGDRLVVFADDGEKLGSWPQTYGSVYEEGWLERFFAMLEDNAGWIETVHLSDYLNRHPSRGVIYIPTASYSEMLDWSGGFWRNFFRKYPEANWMHKRMLLASRRAREAGSPPEAVEEVWKSQCNCPYWHGVFGGLYLPHLRRETYTHILRAEDADRPEETRCRFLDMDTDGAEEALLENRAWSLFFDPDCGGQLAEMDWTARHANLTNTLRRREEPYFHALQTQGQPAGPAVRDWYARRSLIDHFLEPHTSPERFAACDYGEQGDFVNQPYEAAWDGTALTLSRKGGVWSAGRRIPVAVTKRITLNGSLVAIDYVLKAPPEEPLWPGVELNFSLTGPDSPVRTVAIPGRTLADPSPRGASAEEAVEEIRLTDRWLDVEIGIRIRPAASLWRFPVETLSQSEEGADRIYQSTALLLHWPQTTTTDGLWRGRVEIWGV
ncbi:MAG: DUF1926 domain-containing protein [Armatimonadetes bacterium]|nr:DUF1926 domain-containing protein [Armatimonadota bacterium]